MTTKTLWFVVFCFCVGSIASAQEPFIDNGITRCDNGVCIHPAPVATVVHNTAAVVHGVVHGVACGVQQSLAQAKSDIQARSGRMYHVGGGFAGGRYEGVGFSTVSADDAIRRSCYWGRKTPVQIGVSRGSRGWYATVIYR